MEFHHMVLMFTRKFVPSLCLLAVSATSFAQQQNENQQDEAHQDKGQKEEIVTLPNKCDEYMTLSIGAMANEAEALLGRSPDQKNDISVKIYTWRIKDNFITLHYDRGQLTTVEVDEECRNGGSSRLCDLYDKFITNWPDYDAVEYQLGKPTDVETITRHEWVWKNRSEKVYVEVKNEEVEDIECIPTRIRYIYVDEEGNDKSEQQSDDNGSQYNPEY